jgi:hypothetical protein
LSELYLEYVKKGDGQSGQVHGDMNVGPVKLIHLFSPQAYQLRLHHLTDEIPGQKKAHVCTGNRTAQGKSLYPELWIRIRNQEGKNDPQKLEKVKNFHVQVLDVLFRGLKASPVAWASLGLGRPRDKLIAIFDQKCWTTTSRMKSLVRKGSCVQCTRTAQGNCFYLHTVKRPKFGNGP